MFNKVLIANRGEIALRIIRTCKRLGIPTVSVYSEADENALHTKAADEAYPIGKSRVNESYLHIDRIIEAAKEARADAIHPGYGLLSENSRFAERCQKENITFIGPLASIITKMGSKIEARKTMEHAKVPIVPGVSEPLPDVQSAMAAARAIGFPVMLKASAGGGGIGMQLVHTEDELVKAFEGNQKRAASFFGDGSMYMEKVIENARHIEIQILADSFGNTVHLFERDCSVQRRHQKVIEEAPSPFVDGELRQRLGETAVKAAKSIGYRNAGTIEFLVDQEKHIYFLEMNTRLQVEHPVTEEITGFDLVEEQLKIAAGKALSFSQQDITHSGHAIEVRIYAEDPVTFYPSPGTISAFSVLRHPAVRHECAVAKGSTVSPFYDPMIAKMIVTGETRKKAIEQLKTALREYHVEGIKTNIPLLKKIAHSEAFEKGEATTGFLESAK
ncbi:acetyl-CoA carboxylase biotin carboxylase subunit [Bacillus nakamurai]|uniref:biotin carboxylase n=1 Tax=Bacillus nakamurai TaxID=1793963 RepID=A0A150F9G2_9BACI|nr:acetyl-CoA carboxylase biotin carboxylase subunit [Bacillus nakamurai]KXZ21834.1 biotin carboxylase [Bacillus nakamurai]MED1226720.1 acetyl-CoA carboxylase biotin carboxylase subunit [Bacillus nakamurai]